MESERNWEVVSDQDPESAEPIKEDGQSPKAIEATKEEDVKPHQKFWEVVAALTPDQKEIMRWLSQDTVSSPSFVGWLPLLIAVRRKELDMVKKLVRNGVNPDAASEDGWTALHVACQDGSMAIVHYLCDEAGADLERKTSHGNSPLYIACRHGHLDIVRFFLEGPRPRIELEEEESLKKVIAATVCGPKSGLSVLQYLLDHHQYRSRLTIRMLASIVVHPNAKVEHPSLGRLAQEMANMILFEKNKE